MKPLFRLTLAFLLATTSFAEHNPLKDPNVCGRPTCKGGGGKFKYGPGTRQNYKYSVQVRSLFEGTSKNESTMYVEGVASLDFVTPCDGLLTLSDLKLAERPGQDGQEPRPHANSPQFADAISNYTLRFDFHDGIISEICPEPDEKSWALNFKRGLLSMLHNTMKRFDLDHSTAEEDVKGKCTTQYTVKGAKETSLLIEKTKDLSTCRSRSKVHSMVQSVPYNFRPKVQDAKDLLKSSSRCQLSIDHNIYNEITCEESHVLQPFSNQDAGATTIVVQRLILLSEYAETVGEQSEITRRTGLLFDHVATPKPTHGELKASRDLMKEMCRQSTDDVQIEFSDLFTKFIQTLRLLAYPSLTALYGHAGATCPTGKKHLLDALPYVGSSPSVALMKDVILQEALPDSTVKEWMVPLAFLPRPDRVVMEAAAQLLQEKYHRPEVVLSVTALTHTYCSQNPDCVYNEAVNAILTTVERSVVDVYTKGDFSREKHDQIVVALKALSNVGVVSDLFQNHLKAIIEDRRINVGIRVSAVETFRRLECENSRDYFMRLFRNQVDEDAEIRIASYLQVMRCPNYLTLRTVKHALEDEEVNQVGSFVWTHLNNLIKSAIPSRVEIQGLLSDLNLMNKFSSDVRKFSHNREGSLFFEEYNVGASYDGNVIFSPASYVPRSATLNLTVDLFGESVNFMEVYGRLEGFEHYLESVFGPRGPLNSKKIVDKIVNGRWSRSASEGELVEDEIDQLPNVLENSFGEPKVSLGLKVFGNELKYATFDGDEEIKEALRTLNPVDHLKRILSGKEINYNKAAMFLDSDYVVPSGAGLPISVSAIGTASINLKLLGSLHGANFIQTKELDLKADIRPSVSLDLKGVMSVDAFYASAGIKLSSSMYTSSAIEGDVKIRGTKLVSVKFSMPRQSSEIFGVKSELVVMEQDVEQVQAGLAGSRVSKSICSWPAVDKTVGLKLCGEYHFMNVTEINTAPYFVLAGPAGFRLFLEKSDPTAKIYLFEYKWTDEQDLSVVSLTFDTPGSTLRRLLAANFTVDRQSRNLTLFLQSSAGTVEAHGNYKNTDEEKYLQLTLDINDKKHFDLNLALVRENSRNGYTYYPRLYLGVNGERVFELQGTLKLVSKKGISQYDVDLKFQTKRLSSKLFGYISRAEASVAVSFKLDYKFALTKEQRVTLEFSLANRSKNMVDIEGACNLFSTSYPDFNFDARLKFQRGRGSGPIECKFDLSSSPLPATDPDAELHKLKVEWLFSYKSLPDSTLNTELTVSRQYTGLNLKGRFSYEAKQSVKNVLLLVKYGAEKEVVVTVFWSHPKTNLTRMEGRLNITVPSFTSMILQGKLVENDASDYIVEAKGTWFSGHSASASGYYQDRGTSRSLNHHLKLLLKSPSFQDINTDLQFYRDKDELKIDLKAAQDENDYCLFIKHNTALPEETVTLVKLKYQSSQYSVFSSLYAGDHRRITLEFHIDQLRDIHFAAWEFNKETNKALGLEVKWDANRDNNQKLVVSANFTKLASFNYEGNLLISYPGRTIVANFDFLLKNGHFDTLVRLSWADQQTFAVILRLDYNFDRHTYVKISSQIATPFEGWQGTTITGGYEHNGNLYKIDSSIAWKPHEYVSIDLFEDYTVSETTFECKFKTSLRSTLHNVPTLSVALNHGQNTSKVDTMVKLMYGPEHVIDIKSNWEIDGNNQHTNLTGTVIATTPFNGCRRGYLIGKVHLKKTKYVRGFGTLDLDHKKFTVDVEGNLQKLTNSMLVVNVTTPIERFRLIQCRLGFSEERRHLVAQVVYPSRTMGIEVLFSVESLANFDVIFSLGTPISFLEQILIVGKLKPQRADFRIGWNSLLLGFSGVWHYVNAIDFEYTYKIYTPVEGFEENGIVAKLIFKEGLDSELSIRLSDHKLGVAVQGSPKAKIPKELEIKTDRIYARKPAIRSWSEHKNEDDYYDELDADDGEEKHDDPLNWTGSIRIDAIIYPTMQGTLDIDQEGPLYILQAELSLPEGKAVLIDEFEYIDVMTMKNNITITMPYESLLQITSAFKLEIVPEHKYDFLVDLNYLNRTQWVKAGLSGLCTIRSRGDKESRYAATVRAHTPFSYFPRLEARASFEAQAEPNVYAADFSAATNSSDLSVTTRAEIHNGALNAAAQLEVRTATFVIPPTNITIKRELKPDDTVFEAHVHIPKILKREISVRANWMLKSIKQFHALVWFDTPFKGMENSQVGMRVLVGDNTAEAWTTLRLHPLEIDMNSTFTDDIFRTTSNINFTGKSFPLTLTGTIVQTSFNRRDFAGTLKLKEKNFKLIGYANLLERFPMDAQIRLEPQDGTTPIQFDYKFTTRSANSHVLIGRAQHGQKFVNVEANAVSRQRYDWQFDVEVETSHPVYNRFGVQANTTMADRGSRIAIEGRTPIANFQNPKLGASVFASGQQRNGRGYFETSDSKGEIQVDWVLLMWENMHVTAVGDYQNAEYKSQSRIDGFYINPQKSFEFLKIGTDVNIDTLWSTGTNVTLSLPNYQNMNLEAHLKLPPPIKEVYSLTGKLRYKDFKTVEYSGKYRTLNTQKKYGSWGNISFADKTRMGANVDVEWNNKSVGNYLDLEKQEDTYYLVYKLNTPKFVDMETFVTEMSYSGLEKHHNVTCRAFYPADRSIVFGEVDFQEFANMNGTVNVTMPLGNISYAGAHFDTKTDARVYNRYVEAFWPDDTAVVDCRCTTERGSSLVESNTTGALVIELPLQTRHVATIDFDYKKRPQRSVGSTTVDYNGDKVLQGKYNCESTSKAGFEQDTIHVEVQNKLVPVGADYVHGYEYGASRDGSGAPTVDKKHVHLYHLKNTSKFDVTGGMSVRTSSTGRKIAFSATHSNRTVKLWTDYDVFDQQFKQHSRLELSPSTWIEYDLDLLNRTADEMFDAQLVQLKVSYPRRNFTATGSYNISESSLNTDVSLLWDKDKLDKSARAKFDWRRAREQREEVRLSIGHPSFEKDVTFFGEYEYDETKLLDTRLTVDYSPDPARTLRIGSKISDNSNRYQYNYTYNLWAVHDATNLNLNSHGGLSWHSPLYSTAHLTEYKRSYLPLTVYETRAELSPCRIEAKKSGVDELLYLFAECGGEFPTYSANVSTVRKENNATGEFYVNFKEKLVVVDLNMTTDGSQSFHMYGLIPDARNAKFDVWRDYEDIRVSDVAYYLRLNHSRLIVSSLLWRSDLIHDVQSGVRSAIRELYNYVLEGINNTKQYVRSETDLAIHDIWNDAKPTVAQFLEDLRELRVIENDFDELKQFLNASYEANEFYMKDIVNMSLILFDDLALKSLPAIVGEIWEVMGDSGEKIKKSIADAIETIKTYYKNLADFVRGLLDGDPIDHLSDVFKSIVEKYDEFIKELHVAFIQYMEQLWSQTYALVLSNWHKTLAAIEPTFIKMIHYLETIAWNTGRDFLDFLYIRKSELIESPYFAKFTNFTHDVDRFYRDITGNNTIASVVKYAKITWNFLEERYFNLVPFGKELQAVISEILAELNELRNLPSIKYLEDKCSEMYANVKWFWDYFDVETRLHRFVVLLHLKLTDMSQTALEAENRYRVPKTKFIFEPSDGIMLLEQKLPMSWHAFNETPKFHEIPELKTIYSIRNYFVASRTTFWDFYHDYKAYTELSGWLPPFEAQALLVGSRYYVTFDGRHYDLRGGCSYLLATDYVDRNFSVAVSYDKGGDTRKLLLVVNNTLIEINVFTDSVKVGNDGTSLPAQIGDTFLYREAELVTVKSESGFMLECNMKFDICAFRVSGWYFGKTAGLWGTINNEPSDDFLTSDRTKARQTEIGRFTDSWKLHKCNEEKLFGAEPSPPPSTVEICDEFFTSKLSQLATCFPRVSTDPFLSMCLNSATAEEACSSALAYINLCAFSNTPLRVPDVCVKCDSPNGTVLKEGQSIHLVGESLPRSADVIFIVEAKACNQDLRAKRNFDSVVELLNKELTESNITNNRYAVVIFGGDGVFDQPRSLAVNSNVFTDSRSLITYFDSIPAGEGNADFFNAITFAANRMLFRPGVSKNFILMPCSECDEDNMKLDYASVHQLLLESDITLHILMNEEFSISKMRDNKVPFGIDQWRAYTKKDIRVLLGDAALRKQVSLPKSTLGYCTPLALETNGTVFNSKNLQVARKGNAKKFATVFAKRVAASAEPNSCVNCECTAFNSGVSFMECNPCSYPTSASIDYGFDEDLGLALMQPADDFLGSLELK